MLIYKAAYRFIDGAVHGEVLDFPGAITCATNIDEARRLLVSALLDLAEFSLERGEQIPLPNPKLSDDEADLEEPIYLHLRASTSVEVLPTGVVVA